MLIKFLLLLLMFFSHLIADYNLQGVLADLKQRLWWDLKYSKVFVQEHYPVDYITALIEHSFMWSTCITIPLLAYSLASIPGASSVMEYGFVTYSAAAKMNLVSVKPDTIKNYTVYSGPVAAQMAIGAAQKSGAELGVGITGIAGPHAESQPAGTVYIAVANSEIQNVFVRRYLFQDHDRNIIRQKAVLAAMDLVTAVITSTGRQPHFAWSCSPAIIHTVTESKTHSF